MNLDILIAGAGPAGAIAALVLARGGARVTLVDRARFPRDKLCGDTINPGAHAILRRLGLEAVTAGGLRVAGMHVTGERGVRVSGSYGGRLSGISLPRRLLDVRLVEAATAAGARLEEGVLVQRTMRSADGVRVTGLELKLPSGRLERRAAVVTIAADGASSRLARSAGLSRTPRAPRRWAIGGILRGVSGLSAFGEMHVRRHCYMGVAPLADGCANACVVTADRALLRQPDLLMRQLRADDETGPRFARATLVSPPSRLGPLALDSSLPGLPGLLLAGDAAGFIDPMTGDGLRFAFRGAELAALESLRVLESGWQDAQLRLREARRREFGGKWRFNRTLRVLVASPAAIRAAGLWAAISPGLVRNTIRYAGDVPIA